MDMIDFEENANNPTANRSRKDKSKKSKTKMKEINDNMNFLLIKKN